MDDIWSLSTEDFVVSFQGVYDVPPIRPHDFVVFLGPATLAAFTADGGCPGHPGREKHG